VWDRRQGKLLHELRAHTQSVSCAVLAHTGHETKRYAVALLALSVTVAERRAVQPAESFASGGPSRDRSCRS
jgi:hypothetical protein